MLNKKFLWDKNNMRRLKLVRLPQRPYLSLSQVTVYLEIDAKDGGISKTKASHLALRHIVYWLCIILLLSRYCEVFPKDAPFFPQRQRKNKEDGGWFDWYGEFLIEKRKSFASDDDGDFITSILTRYCGKSTLEVVFWAESGLLNIFRYEKLLDLADIIR